MVIKFREVLMKLPEVGEMITLGKPGTSKTRIGKVAKVDGYKIKLVFDDESWVIIELGIPN